MTRVRPFHFILFLLLLSAVSAGFYLYHNLPTLLRLQAQHYLQQHGVDDIEFTGLEIASNHASVDTLVLRGAYENHAYVARLSSAEILFDWRMLLGGKLNALSLSSLDISIAQTAVGQSQATGMIDVETLLPQQLVKKSPLQSLRVEHWALAYHALNVPAIKATGVLSMNGHLDAQLTTTLAGRDVLAQLRSSKNPEQLDLDITLSEHQSDVVAGSAHLSRTADNRWEWELQGKAQHAPLLAWLRELDATMDLGLDIPGDFSLQGESLLTAQVQHPNELNLAAASASGATTLQQLHARFKVTTQARQFEIPDVVGSGNGLLNIQGTLEEGQFQATLQPFNLTANLNTQRLLLPDSWLQWMRWKETVPVELDVAEVVNIVFANGGKLSLQLQNALLSLGETDSQLSLQTSTLETVVTAAEQVEAAIALNTILNTRLRKQTLPALEIAFTQHGRIEESEFSLKLSDTARSVQAHLEGNINLSSGRGKYQLNTHIGDLPVFWSMIAPQLRHYELLTDTVQIRSGSARLNTTIESKSFDEADWEQHSRITLENTAGSLNEYRFEGLGLSAEWSGIARWKTLQPLEASLAKITLGFEVNDIQLRASLPKSTQVTMPQIRIDAFSASLFGGTLTLPEAQAWNFAAASNHITLQAQGWQLAELVALQQNADIQADGTLEGKLPLTVTDGRILIDKGYLRALPPGGHIRYIANDKTRALAENSPELELALNLLSDFQYQVLSSEVQLDQAGNLLLGLSLAGSNPSQYEGQAINFNINVEQNLDPLLQSLRLSDNLVERIEGGLK